MKKTILGYRLKGIKQLKDLKVSFLATDNKTEGDKYSQLVKVFDNNEDIYVSKLNFIHGLNASGKTNLLHISNFVDLITSDMLERNQYSFNFFSYEDEDIELTSYFAIGHLIFKHCVKFNIKNVVDNDNYHFGEFNFHEETLYNYNMDKSKKLSTKELNDFILNIKSDKSIFKEIFSSFDDEESTDELAFKQMNRRNELRVRSKIILSLIEANDYDSEKSGDWKSKIQNIFGQTVYDDVIPHAQPGKNFAMKILNQNEKDFLEFINLFDKGIKSIYADTTTGMYSVKLASGKTIKRTKLEGLLSTGTIRGMVILSIIKEHLALGRDVYMDEIEANFNKNIIRFIIDLFTDKKTNKYGARLFASTHFRETLDTTSRRDSIYLTEWKSGKQVVKRLTDIEEISEAKRKRSMYNSKLIQRVETMDLIPGMKDESKFKGLFK